MHSAASVAATISPVPRRALKGIADVRVGMRLQANTPQGPRAVMVTHVGGDMVTLDGNHPLAGHDLVFEVEIMAARAAREDDFLEGSFPNAGQLLH